MEKQGRMSGRPKKRKQGQKSRRRHRWEKRAVLTAALSERCKSYGEWFDKCPTDGWWGELIVGSKWRIIWRVIEKKLESLVRIFLPSANLPLYTSHEGSIELNQALTD